MQGVISGINDTIHRQGNLINDLNKEMGNVKGLFNVAADIDPSPRGGSWAVVCIAGKEQKVQFVDMSEMDARQMFKFLDKFDQRHRITDAPRHMVRHFRHLDGM